MGTMLQSHTLVRRAALISASEKVSPPKYRSIISSLVSATASISVSRHSSRFALLYSGISQSTTSLPCQRWPVSETTFT